MTRNTMTAGEVVRWVARLASLVSLVVVALMAGTVPGGLPTAAEAVGLALFPVGVLVGFAIAWWREGAGGTISVLSLIAFYAWMILLDGRPPRGPYFALLASPGVLFLASALLARWQRPSPTGPSVGHAAE
jgi:hypothetical protein